MSVLTLLPDRYSVTYAGEIISLLPKEFELFTFLYNNKNQGFSREQLLDAVWALEEPIDRTVDDHIYRLRKKLKNWSHLISIDTIRGTGYRLKYLRPKSENPLLKDTAYAQHVETLFGTYQRYGNGEAIQTLAANKDVLGIKLDPGTEAMLRFMNGEFTWFVDAKDVPFSLRAYILLHIYSYAQEDHHVVLSLFEKYVEAKMLPDHLQKELDDINIIGVYIFAGRYHKALRLIRRFYEIETGQYRDAFILLILMKEITLYFIHKRLDRVESCFLRAEVLLKELPFNREKGIIYVLKGLFSLYKGETKSACHWIDEGLQTLKASRFIPHYIVAVHLIDRYINVIDTDTAFRSRYERIWPEMCEHYQFKKLEPIIKSELLSHL